jgi:DNA (cytosine-5)-methyltransferase 1
VNALYNEIDKDASCILQRLIKTNVIAGGYVDTRSIKELTANDLRGRTQVHLFAGGGLWSVAARMAGWPDNRPLWTASCPCQPFSQAGQGRGFDDDRHLWPDVDRLVGECIAGGHGPSVIVGEQVSGAAGVNWFNGVRTDLETKGYWPWVVDIPACAVDAPHIRQRLYWVAVANDESIKRRTRSSVAQYRCESSNHHELDRKGVTMGDAQQPGLERQRWNGDGEAGRQITTGPVAEADGGNMGHSSGDGRQQGQGTAASPRYGNQLAPTHGCNGSFWSDHEWITCHDGKARRTKPGLRLLVDGLPGRVGLWRVGGNAIVPVLAAQVIGALMDVLDTPQSLEVA